LAKDCACAHLDRHRCSCTRLDFAARSSDPPLDPGYSAAASVLDLAGEQEPRPVQQDDPQLAPPTRDVNPWQMTVESGRRRKLGIVLLYRSRLLLTREVEAMAIQMSARTVLGQREPALSPTRILTWPNSAAREHFRSHPHISGNLTTWLTLTSLDHLVLGTE
jgi:hypothetical protein